MGQIAVIERPNQTMPSFSLSDLEHIATTIARGKMFGSQDPYAVLTLCMLAQAEGQHPAVVFRDYDIIQGKPAKKAKAMLSDFLGAGGKVVWHRLDDECAEATFSHPAGGEATINWTMARAIKAGLGGKDMWKKYPRQMLRSRTVSEGVSTVFPGATSGLYVPEEVMDFAPDPKPATPAMPAAQRARDLKALPAADPAREKAEKWVAEFDGTDTPANQRALAKLQRDFPDLYERAQSPRPAATAPGEATKEAEDAAAPASESPHEDRGEPLSDQALADQLCDEARQWRTLPALTDWEASITERFETLSDDRQQLVNEAIAAVRGGLR